MPKQILLVDDSVTIARVVEITFAQEDFALTVARTADEGIAKAKQLRPDLVLVDVSLSGKSAYDIIGALREDATLAKTACLVLAGNFAPYDEGKGSAAGADGFVVKPFETQPLIDKAKEVIARRAGGETAAAAPAPAAAPAAAPAPVASRPGVESLSKPLSTVAAETTARMSAQTGAVSPVAAGAPPAAARPSPKATLMGIPAVNPAMLLTPVVPAAPNVLRPPAAIAPAPAPNVLRPPVAVAPAPAPKPVGVEAPTLQSDSVAAAPAPKPVPPPVAMPPRAVPAPAPAPFPAAAPNVLRPAAAQQAIPSNVPQMPRPSLVPGVATPTPRAADVPQAVRAEITPATGAPAGMAGIVQQVADRVPSAIAARGAEYDAIAKLSREVIEQIVWEVVPELAESIIRQELDRLVRERQNV